MLGSNFTTLSPNNNSTEHKNDLKTSIDWLRWRLVVKKVTDYVIAFRFFFTYTPTPLTTSTETHQNLLPF